MGSGGRTRRGEFGTDLQANARRVAGVERRYGFVQRERL
jgi:hypothetical protein